MRRALAWTKDDSSPEHGFFLLDDFKFLDPEGLIPNPKYDSASGEGGDHNFGMTMKAVAEFEYVPGQYFEFNGMMTFGFLLIIA